MRSREARHANSTRRGTGTTAADTGRRRGNRTGDLGLAVRWRFEHVNALLKPADVQVLLGVSRAWVYAAVQDGRLPCVRLGGPDGPVRFRPADLERLVDSWARA